MDEHTESQRTGGPSYDLDALLEEAMRYYEPGRPPNPPLGGVLPGQPPTPPPAEARP